MTPRKGSSHSFPRVLRPGASAGGRHLRARLSRQWHSTPPPAEPPAASASLEPPHTELNGHSLSLEEVELKLLLEAVYLSTGLDFRNYRRSLIQKRVGACLRQEHLCSLSELQSALLRDPAVLERLLLALTERRSCLFQEPGFYRAFRQEVVPWLRTYPFTRVWVAGCAGGAEVYSLATLLLEEGLQERCRIYATDLCEPVVQHARSGRQPLAALRRAAANYRTAGGQVSLTSYFTTEDGQSGIPAFLQKNIVFAAHNFMTDASFNEFHFILCRDAMEEFDPILQGKVHELLYGSLMSRGVLGLGRSHRLARTLHQSDYEPVVARQGLYRKKRPNRTD